MVDISNKIKSSISRNQLFALNYKNTQPLTKETVKDLNNKDHIREMQQRIATSEFQSHSRKERFEDLQTNIPQLTHQLKKGQKISLEVYAPNVEKIKAIFGWKILDSRCDMDVSAFLIGANGKVLNDNWVVFYNQPFSPDKSVFFIKQENSLGQEQISINLKMLNSAIRKIVFVLTIDEAFSRNLNFSMIRNAYIQLEDSFTNQEIVSFQLDEYFTNVTSMTMAELYLHNGKWKFNPIGNGIHQDLVGQCRIYGVEIN